MRTQLIRPAILTVLLPISWGCASDFHVEQIRDPEAQAMDTGELLEEEPEQPQQEEEDEPEPPEEEEETEPEEEEEPQEEVDPDPEPEDDCEGVEDLIYVIDQDSGDLYTFDPDSLSTTRLGHLDCDSWGEPGSMGIARDGVGFVRYSDESLHMVDLETLDCSPTVYDDRDTDFGSFGMGYATESADTWRDNLYVANSRWLAMLDPETGELQNIGKLPSQSELTGTAEGQLWAFLPLESPAALVEVDKNTGSILSSKGLSDFPNPSNIDTFAFAAWGGDFYLFVRTYGMGESTKVYEVTESGTMTRVVDGLGLNVVGAGVSTCASTD